MREIGLKVGIAFQIKDDLFDYGLDDVGKPTRNDIQERKVTLPLIKALDNAGPIERLKIRRLMRKRKKSSAETEKIVAFVHENNGMTEAETLMNQYADEALSELRLLPVKQGLEEFEALVSFIINRKK